MRSSSSRSGFLGADRVIATSLNQKEAEASSGRISGMRVSSAGFCRRSVGGRRPFKQLSCNITIIQPKREVKCEEQRIDNIDIFDLDADFIAHFHF